MYQSNYLCRSPYGQGAQYTDYVQPACLPDPESETQYEDGVIGHVSGWGYTEEKGSAVADSLQFVEVVYICFYFICCIYSMIKLRQTPPRISETTVWNGMKIKPQVEETFARLIAKFGHQRLHGFGGMHG